MGERMQERGTTWRAAKARKEKGYTGEGKCVQEREHEQWKGGKRVREWKHTVERGKHVCERRKEMRVR